MEPVKLPESQSATQRGTASDDRYGVAPSDAGLKGYDHRLLANCLDSVGEELPFDAWIAAAGQACYPGSKMLGSTISQVTGGDGQIGFTIPIELKRRCWSAFVVVGQNLLPTQVDIVEKDGLLHPLGVLSRRRSAIPMFGPFCSLQGDIDSVRLRPTTGSIGNASLTFFSFD